MSRSILLDPDDLRAVLTRIGQEIASDHPEGVVLIGVLKGALLFLADLVRAIPDIPVAVDFISISRFAPDSGRVRITQDVQMDIAGRDVVIVEDLVDTGLTLAYLSTQLRARDPRRLDACALLDRESRRIVPETVRYRGVRLEDAFVLGYGLHYRDLYRNLPFVAVGDRDEVRRRPDVYVEDLYSASIRRRDGDNGA
ncbi:MAG TPA: phosphoribosyltransferase family protein [Acidimicrobiia bacterium]|nr:phosphoribosyltransferase family protein [Acidimicrobiia bacterium]